MRQDVSRTPELDASLVTLANSIHQTIAAFADEQGVPDIDVNLVWTSEFVATTQEILGAAHQGSGAPT